jgi:pentatricopeptide repeat protein
VEPNNRTFGCCMNAQAKRGTARTAGRILHKMIDRGLVPSHIQFNAVLDAHAKCQDGSVGITLALIRECRFVWCETECIHK